MPTLLEPPRPHPQVATPSLLDDPDALLTHVGLFPEADLTMARAMLEKIQNPDRSVPWKSYSGHLFSWDVSCAFCDLSLRHLYETGMKMGIGDGVFEDGISYPTWLGRMRKARAALADIGEDELWNGAAEDARAEFAGYGSDSRPDHDSWNYLPDGTEVGARFEFHGRSGKHMVLTRWEHETIAESLPFNRDQIDDEFDGMADFLTAFFSTDDNGQNNWLSLVNLWWFLHNVSRSLESWPPEQRVEDAAAWILFVQLAGE